MFAVIQGNIYCSAGTPNAEIEIIFNNSYVHLDYMGRVKEKN